MAPEQAQLGGPIDQRTDVFGLGAVLYEILTGQPPYSSKHADARKSQADPLEQAKECQPKAPRAVKGGVPRALDGVCRKAMAKNPQERYQSAGELADEVKCWLAHEPVQAWPRSRLCKALVRAWHWVRRQARWVIPVVAGLVAALVVGGPFWLGIERDRVIRHQQVKGLLERVQGWQGQARTAPPDEAGLLLRQAVEAAREASGLLTEGGADADLRKQVQAQLGELEQSEKDQQALERLEEGRIIAGAPRSEGLIRQISDKEYRPVRIGQTHYRGFASLRAVIDEKYRKAFELCGIDVEKQTLEKAAKLIRARAISRQLAVALDTWVWVSRTKDPARAKRLRALVREVDQDPKHKQVREQVREALWRDDPAQLKRLAGHQTIGSLPVPMLVVLASALRRHSALAEAELVLRKAQERHPDDFWRGTTLPRDRRKWRGRASQWRNADDFWVTTDLAVVLVEKKPPQLAEAVRHFTAAVALRKNSATSQTNLGNALLANDQIGEALEHQRKAVDANKDDHLAHTNLGITLASKGEVNEAIRMLRKAIALKHDYAEAHGALGMVLRKAEQFNEALAALEACQEWLEPDDPRGPQVAEMVLEVKRMIDRNHNKLRQKP
jgi:tetratricopeptide (TPR) repeat protein